MTTPDEASRYQPVGDSDRTASEATSDREQDLTSEAESKPSIDSDVAPDTVEGTAEAPALPLDAVFEILKNKRRRITLHYLLDADGQVSLSDLAEHIAVVENDITYQEMTSTERKRAYVGLYQCHLPKMNELGAVTFDRDRGTIDLGPNHEQLLPYLDVGQEADQERWPRYYLGLAVVNATVFGLALSSSMALDGATSGLLVAAVATVGIVSFAALSLVHYFRVAESDSDADRRSD